ncbi:Nucleolar protein 6 [Nymphaea thermarum]|nr:Nucleolar protein 6 [Nymphaea thermarum]
MELDTTNFKVEQLLKEVDVDYSLIKKSLGDALSAIEETVASIPEKKVDASLAPKFVGDLGVPVDKVEFTFKKPETYQIVGSYAIEAVAKPVTNVDVLVRMPKSCFREKDFLDHRYHAKRCLYLSVIAMHLKSCRVVRELQWSTFQNEARKPILVVHLVRWLDMGGFGSCASSLYLLIVIKIILSSFTWFYWIFYGITPFKLAGLDLGAASGFLVRIIPCTTNVFAISKLGLSRNNIRSANQDSQASPNYNSSILEDMFLERNADFVKDIFLGWKDLSQALLLLKIWVRNRSSIYTHDCLNGFLLSVILAYLTTDLGGARVKQGMKPIQIFRVTLDFLATSKLLDKVLFLHSASQHNISEELRDEARWTLNCLDKQNNAGFEEVFVVRVDFAAKFDYCIRIYLKDDDDDTKASTPCLDKELWRISEGNVYSLLVEGLSDRAKFVRVVWRNVPPEWSLEDGLKGLGDGPLIVGIAIASSEKGFRLKDIGPNPENKEEAMNLRVPSGTHYGYGYLPILTVWEFREWENHLIIKAIAEHIVSSHLAIPKERIVVVCDQLDFCLLNGSRDTISYSGDIGKAFDVLSKRLRSLEDLPLRISSVQLLDSASRRASVFPPEPHPLAHEKDVRLGSRSAIPTCVQPMEVMIQLEGSGNWPLDSIALEKTKTAFLLKIGESLQKHWRMMCIATKDEVNVLLSGYAFHLRLSHERDRSLLKTQGMGTLIHNTTPVDNDLLLQSCHSSMLNGLQGRYPMYGPVVRLAKRWVASHLFSNVLKEEAVELLVAYLFLKPFPFYAPFSRVAGFLRFLRLLSEYDWAHTPLIIDVNGDLTLQDEAEINENFSQIRRSNEANGDNELSALFLATKYDKKSEAWTKLSPSTTVLKRIVAYARSADSFVTEMILQGESGHKKWESLFRTPLKNYDAVILLHEDKLAHPERLLFSSDLNLGMRPLVHGNGSKAFAPYIPLKDLISNSQEAKKKLMVNFDPAKCLVEDIKQEFPGIFGLWYDALGGDAIGLTWENPSKRRKTEGNGASTAQGPMELLKRVGDAGKGLVKSIHLLRHPRNH